MAKTSVSSAGSSANKRGGQKADDRIIPSNGRGSNYLSFMKSFLYFYLFIFLSLLLGLLGLFPPMEVDPIISLIPL